MIITILLCATAFTLGWILSSSVIKVYQESKKDVFFNDEIEY